MRGLALALDLPLKTYGTLAVMAAAHEFKDDPLLVAVDAKRDTFYAQAFDRQGAAISDPAALSAAQLVTLAESLGPPAWRYAAPAHRFWLRIGRALCQPCRALSACRLFGRNGGAR